MTRMSSLMLALASIMCAAPKDAAPSQKISDILGEKPFLDIRNKVGYGGERGLLSVAFHPQYRANGFLFVNYTDKNGDTRIKRYTSSSDKNVADPAQARVAHRRIGYRCGAIAALAFSDVMIGMTSNSTMSLQLAIHSSRCIRSSQSIT